MTTITRQWIWMTGLSALLTATGCQTAKTETKTAELPQNSIISEAKPTEMGKVVDGTPTKDAVVVKTMGTFSTNENLKTIFFDLGSSKLSDTSQADLQKSVDWLQQNPPMLLKVAGYADSRGSLIRNKTLAERRALKIKEFYVAHGIPKERILILTQGAEEPTCKPMTEECLAQSRRVETFIESKELASK